MIPNRLGSPPNGQALPACPADLFKAGMPLGRWQVSKSPEDELAEFLKPLPSYMQKVLWYDRAMSQVELLDWMHSIGPFPEGTIREIQQKVHWDPPARSFNEKELRAEFERLLQRCDPSKWEKYRRNAEVARGEQAERFISKPRRTRGRKENVELAQHIWALQRTGVSNLKIKETLEAEGINLSLIAVESYLKSRRRRGRD